MMMRRAAIIWVFPFLLVACDDGGVTGNKNPDPAVDVAAPASDPVAELSEEVRALVSSAAPTNNTDYYVIPESDDFNVIPQDPMNPMSAEKVALGKLLFHDPIFSTVGLTDRVGTWSCASCHHARAGFKSGVVQGISEGGEGFGRFGETRVLADDVDPNNADVQPLTSPTILNAAFQAVMIWNGQFGNAINDIVNVGIPTERLATLGTPKEANLEGLSGIETQVIAGTGVHHLNMDAGSALETNADYKALFDAAFPGATDYARSAVLAIGAYERSVLANRAPFQLWLRGNETAMTETQLRGAKVFFGEGSCTSCHQGPALSSPVGATAEEIFFAIGFADLDQNTIIGTVGDADRLGRGGLTGEISDNYRFKIPQLYNLADSPVFGHGGTFASVREVLEYKNVGEPQADIPAEALDSRFVRLDLSVEQLDDLTVFIEEALRDPDLLRYEPTSVPSGLCIINNDDTSRSDLGCN